MLEELLQSNPSIAELIKLKKYINGKVNGQQSGVPTLYDNMLRRAIHRCEHHSEAKTAAQQEVDNNIIAGYLKSIYSPRFVSLSDRKAETFPGHPSPLLSSRIAWSQGVRDCIKWQDKALFKTCFDFCIYPMLINSLQPKTIFEIGAGTGASAIWFADLLQMSCLDSKVYSVDLKTPLHLDPRVTFINGDCFELGKSLDGALLSTAAHPWLVIEDANVNSLGILTFFDCALKRGDYLMFEDSAVKTEVLSAIVDHYDDKFYLDTYFTDFFGRNATSCQDAILIRR